MINFIMVFSEAQDTNFPSNSLMETPRKFFRTMNFVELIQNFNKTALKGAVSGFVGGYLYQC